MTSHKAFSEVRLSRLHKAMGRFVEQGQVSGAVTMLCRKGQVHLEAIGTLAQGGSEPMRNDSLFRIASATKGSTVIVALSLVEESWRNDPREEMIGILLTQRLVFSPVPERIYTDFWTLAYQAIDD